MVVTHDSVVCKNFSCRLPTDVLTEQLETGNRLEEECGVNTPSLVINLKTLLLYK
jgi:hypothetical protein